MEQKTKALKTSSKVIAVIMKIGYIAMTIVICASVAALIITAVTGGKATSFTVGGTNVIISDELTVTPAELIAVCAEYLVMAAMLLAIFLLAHRMFREISITGDPFTAKHARTVRTLGILVAAMSFAVGITDMIASFFITSGGIEARAEAPGIVFGAVIFCLSYIIDYGCGLREQHEAE